MRLFFQNLAVKIEKLLGVTADKGLPAIRATHKERADTYKRGFNRWRSYGLESKDVLANSVCHMALYISISRSVC